MNIFASPEIRADYDRWGYPGWFPYPTGLLEWTAAALIALPPTRLLGSVLAGSIMGAASTTVLLHGEYDHAVAPLAVLAIVALNGWVTIRRNEAAKHH